MVINYKGQVYRVSYDGMVEVKTVRRNRLTYKYPTVTAWRTLKSDSKTAVAVRAERDRRMEAVGNPPQTWGGMKI